MPENQSQKSKNFKLSSGLPWADTEVLITGAQFGYATMGSDSVPALQLTGLNADGDEQEQSFTIGNTWDIVDGGERVTASNGKADKGFAKTSGLGKLLLSAIDAVGGDPEQMPFDDPKEAGQWVGHKWQTGTVSEPARDKDGKPRKDDDGNAITRDRIVFRQYLGNDGDVQPASSGSSAKPAAVEDDTNDDTMTKLIQLAKDSTDHGAFIDAAFDVPGVEGDSKLSNLVTTRKPEGLWAKHGGK